MDLASNVSISDVSTSLGLLFYIVTPSSTIYRCKLCIYNQLWLIHTTWLQQHLAVEMITILKMMIPREVEEVPDLVGRATPWMVALILIEACINHFHRWGQLLPGGDGGGKLVLQMLMPNVILGRRSKTLPTAWPGKNVRWTEAGGF